MKRIKAMRRGNDSNIGNVGYCCCKKTTNKKEVPVESKGKNTKRDIAKKRRILKTSAVIITANSKEVSYAEVLAWADRKSVV